MRSDVICVNTKGDHLEEALEQTEAAARFRNLSKKDTIHLRLLAEEMLGVIRALTGERNAEYWIESTRNAFELHLSTDVLVNARMRKELLKTATSGKNAAAKGVMGKIRDLFERLTEPFDEGLTAEYSSGWLNSGADMASINMGTICSWSFNRYRENVSETSEEWDELERSIVANLADEVEVGIKDGTVEMVIYKTI